jgi:type II secretory pathway pseudopilin PulG
MKHRRAFLMADAVVGLAIVALLATLLAVAVNRQQMARQRLTDTRYAQRLAEYVLLSLQHNQPIPLETAETKIEIHPTPGGSAPPGYAWTIVQTHVHSQAAQLIGLTPTGKAS